MSDLIPLLTRLIAARTHNPGGDEPALARLLASELATRKADAVEVHEVPRDGARGAYVLARWGNPKLLINAHLDTVPPNDGWSGDPFTARIIDAADGPRLYGLGSADTKGAIAAILCALDEQIPRDTAVLFSGDEELDNTCMKAILATDALRGIERAIVCEPTSMRVGTCHRGILSFEVALRGKGGHSSYADTLPTPLADLSRLAVAFDEWGRKQRALGPPGFPGMCLNVAKLEGGVAFNVVPERGVLTISLRPPPGADSAAIRSELDALVQKHVPAAQSRWLIDSPSFQVRDLAAFTALVGESDPIDLGFWTEAALLSRAGIDAIVIGPGDIARAHAANEDVPIADLVAARDLFTNLFRSTHVGTR